MIVAIDGPAGAGKSTIATRVAQTLGYQLIDTGAMYRVVAHRAQELGLDLDNGSALAQLASELEFSFQFSEDGTNVTRVNGEEVGAEIRTPEVSHAASVISTHSEVRDVFRNVQRNLGLQNSSVMEGRDIGTVIFPDADVKIFLTATPAARAERRVNQLRLAGEDSEFEEVLDDIVARDQRDAHRQIAPLKKADDAVEIDSTKFSIDEVVAQILELSQNA